MFPFLYSCRGNERDEGKVWSCNLQGVFIQTKQWWKAFKNIFVQPTQRKANFIQGLLFLEFETYLQAIYEDGMNLAEPLLFWWDGYLSCVLPTANLRFYHILFSLIVVLSLISRWISCAACACWTRTLFQAPLSAFSAEFGMETISSGISPFVWCSLFSKLCMSYPCYWNVMSIKWIRKSSSTFSSACVLTAIWMPLTCANAWRLSERCSMNWRFLWIEPSVWTLSSSLPLLWLLMEFMDSFFSTKSVEVVHYPGNDLYSYM